MGTFNTALHPRGPNGRFTRSFARHMNSLDASKASKAKTSFRARALRSAADARTYLSGLVGHKGGKTSGGGIRQHIDSGALGRANQTLRAGKTGPEVSAIDAEMKPLPHGLDLYRSVPVSKFGHVDPKSLDGMLVSDAGYFPTTVAPQKAGPGTVQLHVQAPAGTKAAVDPDSGQVVLDHGTPMAVDSVDVSPDGSTRVDLVALSQDDQSAPGTNGPAAPAQGQAIFDARLNAALTGSEALASVPTNIESGEDNRTPEQSEAVFHYFNAGFIRINNELRAGEFDPNTRIEEWVGHIDEVIAGSRLPHEVQAWRGVQHASRMFGDRLDGDLTGMEWREDAYMSTSTDSAVAHEFAGADSAERTQPVVMRLVIPAGTGGVVVTEEDFESEILLQRGLRLRVAADRGTDENGIRQIDVEVIPGE